MICFAQTGYCRNKLDSHRYHRTPVSVIVVAKVSLRYHRTHFVSSVSVIVVAKVSLRYHRTPFCVGHYSGKGTGHATP